jgi:HPt (histidine-containing phosphotransfer) domain-containing protein
MSQEEIAPDFEPGPLGELTQVLPAATVVTLASSYFESVDACFSAFDAATAASDWHTVKEQAHDLKGISGTFGAKRLQQLSDELEHLDFDKESARVPTMLEAMKRTSVAANAAIRKAVAVSAAA